jgi:acyl-homoserine lactone acylase PvdQ
VAVPGWTKDYDWLGFVPPDEMPHGYNPEKGTVVAVVAVVFVVVDGVVLVFFR